MPFTSAADLRITADREHDNPIPGYVMLFRLQEAEWVADWYEEETAIHLPAVEEWLRHARDEHRWFATFRPSTGEDLPTLGPETPLELRIGDSWHRVDWLDEIHGVLGRVPWQVLAGAGDPPPEPGARE